MLTHPKNLGGAIHSISYQFYVLHFLGSFNKAIVNTDAKLCLKLYMWLMRFLPSGPKDWDRLLAGQSQMLCHLKTQVKQVLGLAFTTMIKMFPQDLVCTSYHTFFNFLCLN